MAIAAAIAIALLALLALPCFAAPDDESAATTSDSLTSQLVVNLESNPPQNVVEAPEAPAPNPTNDIINSLTGLATSFLGTPYRWGGTTPKAFDCSGFVRYCYSKLGVKLPRTARQQYKTGMKVLDGALKAGDLIFFNMMKGYVSHVGMYIGNHRFIHAANPRRGVRIDSIRSPAYKRHIVGVRRYLS